MNEFYEQIYKMMDEYEDTFYSKGEHNYLDTFINNYTENNFDEIKFDWNGRHAEEFVDTNFSLRQKIMIYYILHPLKKDNILLLKDLFVEQCKWCKEAWGANDGLGLLGQMLLNKSLGSCIVEFIEFYDISMDTYGECLGISLTQAAKKVAIDKIYSMIENKEFSKFTKEKLKNDLEWINNRQVYL